MKLIKWLSIALAVFTVLLTIFFFGWWAMKDSIVFGQNKFDQVQWMQSAATIATECKRGDMAYDLQQNVLLKGAPKTPLPHCSGAPALKMGMRSNMIWANACMFTTDYCCFLIKITS